MSLKEISTLLAFDNIPSEYCKFEVKSDTQHLELSLHGGMYILKESAIDEMNKLANPYNVKCNLVGRCNQKVKVMVGESHIFRPNNPLSFVLGLGMEHNYTEGKYTAHNSVTLPPPMQISTLY